ncbi:hypothetical protein PflSS101_2703 [Pseudomonas lactis]|uniref:Uncharacterized protein n=1 Tax=Pseudomonas lactis TaxID=1615674 RepID=I4K4J6_9PSED|nr:hypothetical protein PflSS101_2703 [Pseudomonas lactis]
MSVYLTCFCAELSFKGVHKKFFLVMLVESSPHLPILLCLFFYIEGVLGGVRPKSFGSEKLLLILYLEMLVYLI